MDHVLRQIRRMAGRPVGYLPTDEELIERFLAGEDEEAFEALVRRHGPMVLGVCMRLLHHRQDAEDAFQATFLTLVRKGHLISQRGALSSWLHRVAFRVALRLKAKADKIAVDVLTEVAVDADPCDAIAWRELRPVLDTEVSRLPAKYRAPIVLCYLEGKTYEEAARELGCPKGTIAIRLLRGKLLLKNRLTRRGLMLSAGLIVAHAVLPQVQAAVPLALQAATMSAGTALAAGAALSAAAPAAVAALVKAIAYEVWVKKFQMATAVFVGLALSGVGIGTIVSPEPKRTTVPMTEVVAKAPVVPKIAEPVPQPTPLPKLQPELPTKPDPKPDGSQSIVVIDCTTRSWSYSLDDVDHLIRGPYHSACGFHTQITIRQGSAPCEKRHPAGLALRNGLTEDVTPPLAPLAAERKVAITKTAVVYRFKLANGTEVHVIVIDPT